MINHIECCDCLQFMSSMPENSVDLVVTSPPYALRRKDTYGGIDERMYPSWFFSVASKLYRVLKPTGSFVLNIKENVNDGVRSPYVEKTLVLLRGLFRFSDTFIWVKTNPFPTGSNRRLKDGFEYCYWFTKSEDFKFYPDNVLVPSVSEYFQSEMRRQNKGAHDTTNGSGMNMSKRYVAEYVRPSNVLTFPVDSTNHVHPAAFPKKLPLFFIKLMTDEGDLVFDPFCGSGTTCLAARDSGRNYLGCDVQQEYVTIARERLFTCMDSLF